MGTVCQTILTDQPIELSVLERAVADPRLGGIVTFCGVVRAVTGDEQTSRLEYQAHESMALAQMNAIAKTASEKWEANVAIAHRIGVLEPGDIAVICVAACAHRNAAFEACRYLIDTIKQDVPIWKKEFGPEGEIWVSGSEKVK